VLEQLRGERTRRSSLRARAADFAKWGEHGVGGLVLRRVLPVSTAEREKDHPTE